MHLNGFYNYRFIDWINLKLIICFNFALFNTSQNNSANTFNIKYMIYWNIH